MKIAVVGATGLVGTEMLKVLAERINESIDLIPVASERSVGKEITFAGKNFKVVGMQTAIDMKPEFALFSAGGSTSLEWAPKFAEAGITVIDNSSAWRMDPSKKLIVPEINGHILTEEDKIIANPNCSTIQMVMVLGPLHQAFGIKRVVASTYQAVTGTGKAAVDQLMNERNGTEGDKVYPHPIDLNVLPHIDVFQPNGYTKEEMKMVNETKKILNDQSIQVTATCVRLPVMGGHSESINVEFVKDYVIEDIYDILRNAPGVVVQDNVALNEYPMPLFANGKDEVFVGRIRRDESVNFGLNMWIVADNLRKGAATNAVQILEYLVQKKQAV
jgi:aspartate-semialdehyde dehydrogenase